MGGCGGGARPEIRITTTRRGEESTRTVRRVWPAARTTEQRRVKAEAGLNEAELSRFSDVA